jgi:hypothetical protein
VQARQSHVWRVVGGKDAIGHGVSLGNMALATPVLALAIICLTNRLRNRLRRDGRRTAMVKNRGPLAI